MPRKPGKVPSYCRHKASGRAVVRLHGHDHYLGPYGSPESHEKYERLIAQWRTGELELAQDAGPQAGDLTVNKLLLHYWRFATEHYKHNGKPGQELTSMREAIRPLRRLYGGSPVRDFGPRSLKAVRQQMIDQGWARGHINRQIGRLKRIFKWAVSEELAPASIYHGLQTVTGLRYGRTEARETEPVRPVPDEDVEGTLPFVAPPVAAMIKLQRLTGCRPGEVVAMRGADIDQSGDIWVYEAADHKNRWRGHRRLTPLGPKAQAVIRPFLDRAPEKPLFSPQEAEKWRYEQQSRQPSNRKTPVYPCERRALQRKKEAARKRKPKRPKGEAYTVHSYRRAITYGIQKANKAGVKVSHWSPGQLRHTRGTELRREHGIEAAQVSLGHSRADVTQVYAERNLRLAIEIARKSG